MLRNLVLQMIEMTSKESRIKRHWQAIPVGENVIGSLSRDFGGDYAAFFNSYDHWLYKTQSHILDALNEFQWKGRRVLEIGLGQGSDSEQLIKRGALWSGIDLTAESVTRVRKRLELRSLPYENLVQASATNIPFRDRLFDMVYSHGVLHHIPNIKGAQQEIRRVLKEDGRLVMMVYARNSLNYQVAIKWLRRMGLALMYVLPVEGTGIYTQHKKLAKQYGLFEYLKMKNFLHRSTDGPENPYSKVYDERTIKQDFPDFHVVRTFKRWMHAPPLPVHGLPGEKHVGWHLWAELKARAEDELRHNGATTSSSH
ncbi:MAG: class I SAM-dependent methyltransferase [Acidobacteriaceae bacterium]|nr:class I SAM-dependent methyltransferase [Acidobacteriaceae bacterium]MBV9939074.1 class I SAM-dependent methyltransferase [Acidobacteriaceae bacterium]